MVAKDSGEMEPQIKAPRVAPLEVASTYANEMKPQMNTDECRLNASSEQILEVKPQINADERRLNALYEKILNVSCEVSNVLDAGFLKKVYEDQVKAHTVHFAQCLNYLRITGLKLCLLLNFCKTKVEIKRLVNGI